MFFSAQDYPGHRFAATALNYALHEGRVRADDADTPGQAILHPILPGARDQSRLQMLNPPGLSFRDLLKPYRFSVTHIQSPGPESPHGCN